MWNGRKKYGNVPTVFNGRTFDSKKEADHAKKLEAMRYAKQPQQRVKSVISQYKIPIVVNNVRVANYIADFHVLFADGHKEIHEVKSVATRTAVYLLKKKLVEAIYGVKVLEF